MSVLTAAWCLQADPGSCCQWRARWQRARRGAPGAFPAHLAPVTLPSACSRSCPARPHKVLATREGWPATGRPTFRSAAFPGSRAGALRDNGPVTSTIMNSSRRWSRNASSTNLTLRRLDPVRPDLRLVKADLARLPPGEHVEEAAHHPAIRRTQAAGQGTTRTAARRGRHSPTRRASHRRAGD